MTLQSSEYFSFESKGKDALDLVAQALMSGSSAETANTMISADNDSIGETMNLNSASAKRCDGAARDFSLDALTSSGVNLICPALSLRHKDSASRKFADRKQAEDYAAALLARPMRVSKDGIPEELCAGYDSGRDFVAEIKLEDVSSCLLRNVYESFAVLIDSRIRAYASFLARHALARAGKSHDDLPSILNIKRKIECILAMGSRIYAEAVVTRFEIGNALKPATVDSNGVSTSKPLTITLALAMDVVIPTSPGNCEVLAVSISVPGLLVPPGAALPNVRMGDHVNLTLDTHELLVSLMSDASRVVGVMVDAARLYAEGGITTSVHGGKHDDGMPDVPPPSSRETSGDDRFDAAIAANAADPMAGLELLSSAAAELPVVSPDLFGVKSNHFVPCLILQDFEDVEAEVSDLSPDQCAHIVDDIFGELDDAVLTMPPLTKKPKIQET